MKATEFEIEMEALAPIGQSATPTREI